ncbi:hypothetical protein PFDG_05164, partial [Plasmodium falciparum Dd2]
MLILLYHIKCESTICLDLEINQDELKKEKIRQGSFPINVVEVKCSLPHTNTYTRTYNSSISNNQKATEVVCRISLSHSIYNITRDKVYISGIHSLERRHDMSYIVEIFNEIENNLLDKKKEGRIPYIEIGMKDIGYYIHFFFDEFK